MTINNIINTQTEEKTSYLVVAEAVLNEKHEVTKNVQCRIAKLKAINYPTLGNSLMKKVSVKDGTSKRGKRIIKIGDRLFINAQLYALQNQELFKLSKVEGFLKLKAFEVDVELNLIES